MDMKYVYIAEYRAKLDVDNVLVIHVASNDENMEGAVATAVMDGTESMCGLSRLVAATHQAAEPIFTTSVPMKTKPTATEEIKSSVM